MSKLGVDEFAPELLTLMKVAFKKEILVPVATKSQAIAMRYRINLLKSRIRESRREDLIHLTKTQARIEPDPRAEPNAKHYTVHVGPPDQNLTPFIKAALAGVDPSEIEMDAPPDLSILMSGASVDQLPEGAGEPLKEVLKEEEAWPLPNTHKPQEPTT